MSRKIINLTLSVFLLTLIVGGSFGIASEEASSMMCDSGVVEKGDFFQTVQDKCGEPDSKEGGFWRYNFGPDQPVYTLEFDENNNVIRIVEDQSGS
jgi:hypothetical protein